MSYRSHNVRDANQAEVVAALRERGAYVVEIEHPLDLLVGYRGRWCLVEVKAGPKARIRPSQKAFVAQVNAMALPAIFVFTLRDIDNFFPLEHPSGDKPATSSGAHSAENENPVNG